MDSRVAILSPSLGWALIAGFALLWLALGWWWGRKGASLDGFMLANRNVGLALGAATAVATWITSNTTMLAPQLALEMGVWGMLSYATASIGLLLFAPMAKRIRALMPQGYTSAEFVRLRFGKTAWVVFLIISLFYALTWLVSMGMAGGLLLEALAGIPYHLGMTVILAVCVGYTVVGGLHAVIGTDFIQSLIVLVGVVVVVIAVLARVDPQAVHAALLDSRPALLDVLFPAALMSVFNGLLFGLGEIFHSNVWWSRALAMREGVGQRAYALAGLIWLPVPILAGFLGLAAASLDVPIVRPDMVGPLLAAELLGSAGAVLVFVVVFASLASSIDSLLAATSDLVVHDVIHGLVLRGRSDLGHQRRHAAWAIVGLGVLTWLLCLPKVGTLATVLFFAGPLVGSTIWPILAGLYWRRANPRAATWGMIVGSLVGLGCYLFVGWYTGALVGTSVSLVVVAIGTKLAPREDFEWSALTDRDALAEPEAAP
ncbi:urea transporter [Pseudenhygromyxa sp. WMMC2535]|uniref:sodium:solute symporter family transporter n=1 Tax=Pseudenhygromyxa sp. WMMC2535 TaxID=2712867 RepID=UPI00155792D7|nr:urea transporter [Pseudenhygromyxa sp. WMMC2535]NVB41039.1 urea transporter [Pseudenhygromyxa sp. WMMC2535]